MLKVSKGKKKYFKNNESYFKYLHKHKDLIDVIKVIPIMRKNSKSHVCLFYQKKELAL